MLKERDMPPISTKKVRSTQKVLRMYDGSLISPLAAITCSLHNPRNGQEIKDEFVIVRDAPISLLEAQACQKLDKIRVQLQNVRPLQH